MKPLSLSTLQWALVASVSVHATLLSVRFIDPEAFDRVFEDQPLEVILVNAKSREKPSKAQAIAQTQLAGGGEAESGRATSPLPPSALTDIGDTLEDATARQLQSMQEQQTVLLTQLKKQLAALPPPEPRKAQDKAEDRQREEKRQQLIKLLAEIEQRINTENARPKKRYVAPSTKEAVYAVYYDNFRQIVEARGTSNFPHINGKKLYGELTMVITIHHDGHVVETEIAKSSGTPVLDKRAAAIVRSAGDFGSFTPTMRRQFDQLVVVTRFRFTRDETLQAQVTAPEPQ